IVVGLFGEAFVRDRLIVSGDATATAANIRSMESLWRFHIAAELFLLICAVALLLDLVCLAETSQQRSRFAGGILQSGIDRPRSRDYAVSRWGVVSAGECWIPQSICAGAALRHGEPVAQIA